MFKSLGLRMRAFTKAHEGVHQGRACVFMKILKKQKVTTTRLTLKDEDGWNGWMNG